MFWQFWHTIDARFQLARNQHSHFERTRHLNAHAIAAQTVLFHGAAGNVGAYAVKLAQRASQPAIASAGADDLKYVKSPGTDQVVDHLEATTSRLKEIAQLLNDGILVPRVRTLLALAKAHSAAFFLRAALGLPFLSALADRFALWGADGAPHVAVGDVIPLVLYKGKPNR